MKRIFNFINFINESNSISELIEDCFTEVCDDYSLDIDEIKGYYCPSSGFIHPSLLKDILTIRKELNLRDYEIYDAYQVTIGRKSAMRHEQLIDFEDYSDSQIDELNKSIKSAIDRFIRMNPEYTINQFRPFTKKSWSNKIYIVSNTPISK